MRKEKENKRLVYLHLLFVTHSRNECYLQQAETTAQRQAERAEAYVAPEEDAAPTVEEKRKRKHREEKKDTEVQDKSEKKKKKRKVAKDGDDD